MISLLRENQSQIAAICREYAVERLDVFGSASTGRFDPECSDIDFIASFGAREAGESLLDRYIGLANALEALLARRVDVITPRSMKNPYFIRNVEATRELLYAA